MALFVEKSSVLWYNLVSWIRGLAIRKNPLKLGGGNMSTDEKELLCKKYGIGQSLRENLWRFSLGETSYLSGGHF